MSADGHRIDSAEDDALRAVLDTPDHVRTRGALANTLSFAWRALLKIKHTPEQLFDILVTPIMFTVIFTYLFGGALAGSTGDYLQFLLPGMLAQTVVFTTIYTGFTLNGDIGKGVYDRFRSMPIWPPAPIVGAMVGDLMRYTISSLIVIIVGLLMGYRPPAGIPGVIGAVLLLDVFALGIGWIFTTIGLLVRSASTVMTLSWLALMPLTFASNIYVDPATMPAWLQAFVRINPVALLVTAIRGLMNGNVTLAQLGWAVFAPAVIATVCAPLTMWLYRRKR